MVQIAIVDDNETWCFVLATVLSQEGYTVDCFTDTYTFLPRADRFDLAIIDFSIPARPYQPELDGLAVIRHLKNQLSEPPLVILISSYFTDNLLEITQDFCPQADLILSKQIGIKPLLQHVEQLLATDEAASSPTPRPLFANETFPHAVAADASGDGFYEQEPQILTNSNSNLTPRCLDQPS